jgi:hypothetical protein
LGAVLSSFVFDYVVRQKSSQPSVTIGTLHEAAAPTVQELADRLPAVEGYESPTEWLSQSVGRLAFTAADLSTFAADADVPGHASPAWDPAQRALLQAQIDAASAVAFGCEREELEYIIDSFRGLREAEMAALGVFMSKSRVLAWFDEFGAALERQMPICLDSDQITAATSS